MSNLDTALTYLRSGWSVVPLAARSKRPAVRWQEYQQRLPTEDEVRSWWTEFPDAGIAIVTGAVSGLVVIDVDPRNGGDPKAAWENTPTDLVVETGGGGIHLYCFHPGGHVPCGKTSMPGVDRKGDGGYVVAPPSIHPDTGNPYTWIEEGEPCELPAWALEAPAPAPAESDSPRRPWIAEALAHPEKIQPGEQEATLTRLCWWASNEFPYDIALAILSKWVERLPLGRPDEPWSAAHVQMKLDYAYAKRKNQPPAFDVEIEGLEPAPPPSTTPPPERTTAKIAALWDKLHTAREFTEKVKAESDKTDWIVRDFVAPGCWTEVIGTMKEGKSTLVCGMLRSLLDGGTFLDRPCRKTNVFYLTEQVGLSFKATLERGKLQDREDLYVLTIADLFGLPWPDAVAAVIDIAKAHGCGVIVVDTLTRLAGITEEDEAKSVEHLNPFLKARAEGLAVVFVRHARKAGGAINVAARGTGAITGEMDICLYITAPQGVASNYRHLEGVSRLTDTIEEHLEYRDGTYVKGEPPRNRQQQEKDERLERLRSVLSQHPLSILTLAELYKLTSIPKASLFRYLTTLQDAGIVRAEAGGYKLVPSAEQVAAASLEEE